MSDLGGLSNSESLHKTADKEFGEIDLYELLIVVWKNKWIILSVAAIFAVGSVFYAKSIPDQYKSSAILAPTSTSNGSSLSKLASQFGGLATLAGVHIGSSGGEKTAIAIELIKTWDFLEGFIRDNELEVEVFAVSDWDKQSNRLIINDALYDVNTQNWVPRKDHDGRPSSWALFSALERRISVSKNDENGLVTISVEHYSPYVAKKWVDLLVVAINKHLQLQDRKEALNNIAYLKEQVKQTSIAEMQNIFYQLIEEQAKTLMLAEISEEYVFKTISPAKVAEKRSKPGRKFIVIFSMICGGGVAVLFVILREFLGGRTE